MPLYTLPSESDEIKPAKTQIADPSYINSVVDTRVTPVESILAYISGSNWGVNYYSQMLGSSEETKAFDPNQLAVYQNYHKINQLILKLQGSLTVDDDASTNGRISMTGTAVITPMPNLIPNVGDVIVGDIGQGKAGQFSVVTIRKLTHLKATAYELHIRLDREVSQSLQTKLDSYVSKESYYQRDYLITGQDALLTSEQYHSVHKLSRYQSSITNFYLQKFMSVEAKSLVIPNQKTLVYDPYLVSAVLKIFDPEMVPKITKMVQYNVEDHHLSEQMNIFDVAMNREIQFLPLVFSQFVQLDVELLAPSVFQSSVRYSAIKQVIIPRLSEVDVDNDQTLQNWVLSYSPSLTLTNGYQGGLISQVSCPADPNIPCEVTDTPTQNTTNTIKYNTPGDIGVDIPTITNQSYIFSQAFYNHDLVTCTIFERLVLKMMGGEVINATELYPFCDRFYSWGRLEQFYLGPFLVMLIRSVLYRR